MSREIIFDIETVGDIKEVSAMKITVVSIYDYASNQLRSFEEAELSQLWSILEKAERLIGYNSEHFDLPILNQYYPGDLLKFPHLDIMKVIKDAAGTRFKLNDVAKATLQIEKIADGFKAMDWYEQGKIEEIKKYCEQDVRLTKEIYEYGRKNKMLYYPKLTGGLVPMAVNFDPPSVAVNASGERSGGINLTLPL